MVGFTDGEDRIDVAALGVSEFSGLKTTTTSIGTLIDLESAGGGSIVLAGFAVDDLDASDFVFAQEGADETGADDEGGANEGGASEDDSNTIRGDDGDNLLRGTAGNDRLYGEGGDESTSGNLRMATTRFRAAMATTSSTSTLFSTLTA